MLTDSANKIPQHNLLLNTKLYIPKHRLGLVQRSRLTDRLNSGLPQKLALVSAPAGFGKTTLVSEWVHQQERPAAWLSLDEADNDLTRFLSYFVAALQRIETDTGASILSLLQSTQSPPIEAILTFLINEIAAISDNFVLILDDYHLITDQSIHDALGFILDHLPPNMHLVLIGRVDPPISLSRLRVQGEMNEIRTNDLRFTENEAASFLNDLMKLDLSPEDISALESRTEGWIASLQLAGLSLQGRQDKKEFVATFSGDHHYILDYLVDEVMSRQPEEIQSFLIQTSILDRLCAPLCDAILEISTSKQTLQFLEGSNLFLIPLDDERDWYRYHHLFADFLYQRLRDNDPHSVPGLHRRASEWLEHNDLIVEAVNHSLVGEDYERAAQLVESIGPDMMMQSEFDQLGKWLDAMPKELVENWPWLCIIRAWMYDRWAQFEVGEQYLQYAEAALISNPSPASGEDEKIIRGQISAIRALYALKKAQIPQSIEFSNQALDYLPKDYFNRGVAYFSLGWAKKVQGDLSGAIQAYDEGRRASLAAGNQILAQVIILDIGKTQSLQGHLHQAAETFREAIGFKYEKSEIKIPYASPASISLANILREWNELDAAMSHLEEGIEIGLASKIVDGVAVGYASMALVALAQGDLEAAIQACKKTERMVKDIPDLEPETLTITLDSRVRLSISQNKLTEAARYIQESGLSVDTKIKYIADFEHIVLARVLIHSGRENSAAQDVSDVHKLLEEILKMASSAGYLSLRIEALALQALAFDVQGKHDQALNSLEEALSLAESEGYIRTFVDEGEPMAKLLRSAASRDISKNYVHTLLAAFEPGRLETQPIVNQSLVEPLSNRELEVLRLLSTDLSGPEIAQELSISLNTMRTHTKNIYSKLDVNNRRTAILKADEFDLL
ncbi:MAG: LuxR C-terminal-related transcriptional regulator [Anaerolineales bacterium]